MCYGAVVGHDTVSRGRRTRSSATTACAIAPGEAEASITAMRSGFGPGPIKKSLSKPVQVVPGPVLETVLAGGTVPHPLDAPGNRQVEQHGHVRTNRAECKIV